MLRDRVYEWDVELPDDRIEVVLFKTPRWFTILERVFWQLDGWERICNSLLMNEMEIYISRRKEDFIFERIERVSKGAYR